MVFVLFVLGVDGSGFLSDYFGKLNCRLIWLMLKKFDIILIEKGSIIWSKILRFIKKMEPETKLISISEDDMYARHNRSFYYTKGLSYYDIVFTTKVYNLAELIL